MTTHASLFFFGSNWLLRRPYAGRRQLTTSFVLLAVFGAASTSSAERIHRITVDGDFSDWAAVPSYTDPDAAPGVLHDGIPDTHHTDADTLSAVPDYRNHPDVDLLEYKFTHDENNLYAYFRADGVIGRTQQASEGRAGRYYVIVTIDVDNDDSTGYYLHEGGYFPTSGVDRYDMNMEAEFYDGQLNTAHYLSHDAVGTRELHQDFLDLTSGAYARSNPGPYTPGFVQPAPGTYDEYTQWVYHVDDTLTLVEDRGPVVTGIMTLALSPDGHELEMRAPFKGFLNNASGVPNMALGKTIDVSFSLEASGELAPDGDWASDTADPIVGYYLGVPEPACWLLAILGMLVLSPRRSPATAPKKL